MHERASGLAALWQDRGVVGEPVLLALPSGLKFVEALLACWYAGAIAVPVSLPRHARVKHRLDRVVNDAKAKFVICLATAQSLIPALNGEDSPGLHWLDVCEPVQGSGSDKSPTHIDQPVALLQYTSGSTGNPRGVIVTHANLTANSAMIAHVCGHGPEKTIGGWLPLFHDMGLVGLLIQAAYSGARCVFMSPERFLMRPHLWLQMISDFGICSSPAPNFAYDYCSEKVTHEQKANLDLRGWTSALNGAEPVRARTMERFADSFQSCGFSKSAFFPCYGLAEATLLVTGRPISSEQIDPCSKIAGDRVACGVPLGDTQIVIVDPQRHEPVEAGQIGEIWVTGSTCAQGYWNDPELTRCTFKARLKGTDIQPDQRDWLRTGDLGFIQDEQLFITGRIRDLIIIAGRNFFPADLEQTAESAHPSVEPSGAAAFSTEIDQLERLIIAIELRRDFLKAATQDPAKWAELLVIRRQIHAAVAADHGVTPFAILLLPTGSLPRTTSGKIRRGTAREQYLDQTLKTIEPLTSHKSDVVSTI